MKKRTSFWIAAALGLVAVRAEAQADRLARRLDSVTNAAVAASLDSARQAGLPLEPLIERALEGASKGAAGARIVAAVRRLAADLAAAHRALGDQATAAELEAGASALRAGIAPSALADLREARQHQDVTVPLAVLADLVARGVPADTAAAFVLSIAQVSDEQYVAFQRNVERDIALGAPPIAAAAVRVAAATPTAEGSGVGAPPPRPRRP